MSGICFKTGWSEEYAYERDMIMIYDIVYCDLEYFPAGAVDAKKDFEMKRKLFRG
jgi:hypothetical protein